MIIIYSIVLYIEGLGFLAPKLLKLYGYQFLPILLIPDTGTRTLADTDIGTNIVHVYVKHLISFFCVKTFGFK